ncbi:3-oxoacyl-[acyl-carrier-protein] reductase FabG [Legionella pneumophila]|nr:3-oxoacyl-[acyl-carrier-protein] reductase FabG [Legionella pneumophila]
MNTVSPGYINTEMLASLRDDILEAIVAQIPVGRLGKPQEIARVVAFLAEEQSGFITGANFDINGGQYM